MTNESDNIAGISFVHGLAFVAEELVRTGEPDFFLGARVMDGHVAVKLAGANADECDAVAMFWIHVRLNLEDETRERGILRRDLDAAHHAGFWRGRVFQETVEQELHTEVVDAAAEKDRRGFTSEHCGFIEGFTREIEHLQFFNRLGEISFTQIAAHIGIV